MKANIDDVLKFYWDRFHIIEKCFVFLSAFEHDNKEIKEIKKINKDFVLLAEYCISNTMMLDLYSFLSNDGFSLNKFLSTLRKNPIFKNNEELNEIENLIKKGRNFEEYKSLRSLRNQHIAHFGVSLADDESLHKCAKFLDFNKLTGLFFYESFLLKWVTEIIEENKCLTPNATSESK